MNKPRTCSASNRANLLQTFKFQKLTGAESWAMRVVPCPFLHEKWSSWPRGCTSAFILRSGKDEERWGKMHLDTNSQLAATMAQVRSYGKRGQRPPRSQETWFQLSSCISYLQNTTSNLFWILQFEATQAQSQIQNLSLVPAWSAKLRLDRTRTSREGWRFARCRDFQYITCWIAYHPHPTFTC